MEENMETMQMDVVNDTSQQEETDVVSKSKSNLVVPLIGAGIAGLIGLAVYTKKKRKKKKAKKSKKKQDVVDKEDVEDEEFEDADFEEVDPEESEK